MPSVEGLRENRTEEGTPYVVGLGAGGKRWRQKVLNSLGVSVFHLFSPWQGLVAGLKRAPHIGCMMLYLFRACQRTELKRAPACIGVHV